MKKKITILIPCFNEELVLPLLVEQLFDTVRPIVDFEWELLFVNDGSSDQTIRIIKNLQDSSVSIKYIDLSRNFGKEIAMMAGLDHVKGDAVIIMDADLQHPPIVIPELIKHWCEGYDDVAAQRRSLTEATFFKSISSKMFHYILSRVSKTPIQEHVGDFRLLDRKCIDAMCEIRDAHRYTKGLYSWIGFNKKIIMYDEPRRSIGTGKFRFLDLLNLAVEGITSFTVAPLRIAFFLGLVLILFSMILTICLIFSYGLQSDCLNYYILLTVIFTAGIQLLSLGVIGEYIGRMFLEVKQRPPYLIKGKNC